MKFCMWCIFTYLAFSAIKAPDPSGIFDASLYLAIILSFYPIFRRRSSQQQ